MSNFDQIMRVWNNLDSVKESKFSSMSNTDFFKKILGFSNGCSGLSSIQSKVMDDLADDPDVYKQYQLFLSKASALSKLLEMGIEFSDEYSPSEIYDNAVENLNMALNSDDESLSYESIRAGVLDVVDPMYNCSAKELLSSGNVFSFCTISNGEVVSKQVKEDPNGYKSFNSDDECASWLMSKIATQESYEACTDFEKSVVISTLYAIQSDSPIFPVAYVSKELAAVLDENAMQFVSEKRVENLKVDLGSAVVTKSLYYAKMYDFVNVFGRTDRVVIIQNADAK